MDTKRLCSDKTAGVLLALLVCALWGSLFPFVKIGYAAFRIVGGDIPSIVLFAGVRFTLSGVILLLLASAKDRRLTLPSKKAVVPILLVALTSIVLHYSFTYIGLSLGEGSKSAIVKQVGFLFLSCFAFLFDKTDRFTVPKLLSGILGFLGILVTGIDGTRFRFALGDAVLILASFCSVASFILSKKAMRHISPALLVAYSQLLGGVCLCVGGLALGGRITYVDARAAAVFGYICFASITAYTLWNTLLKYQDISKLSVIKFAEPLFAVIFSGLLLGEDVLRPTYLIALLIILAAILLSHYKRRT